MPTFKTQNINTLLAEYQTDTKQIVNAWKRKVAPPPKPKIKKRKNKKETKIDGYEYLLYCLLTERDVFKHYSQKIPNDKRTYYALIGIHCGQKTYDALRTDVKMLINAYTVYSEIFNGKMISSMHEVERMYRNITYFELVMETIYNTYSYMFKIVDNMDAKDMAKRRGWKDTRMFRSTTILGMVIKDLYALLELVETINV